ncbi:MAG: hypothetical protein SOX22_01435 [Bacteroidaceae bacterium]|nr:hypothetical protein [Bacteroidaceae bacterium]
MRFFLPEERGPKSILLWESIFLKNENRCPFSIMGIYLPEERGPKSILLYGNLSP